MTDEKSANNVQSDSGDVDQDALGEREKLQRHIRIMKREFDAFRHHSLDLIRKQCLEIEKLSKEDEELQKNLHVSSSQARKQSDSQYAHQHRALLNQCNDLDKHAKTERAVHLEYEQELQTIRKKLGDLKYSVSSHNQNSTSSQIHKATFTLENNLERTVIHFNKQMAKNNQLRKVVVKLYEKRVQFQELYHSLYKVLQKIRQEIGDLIGMASAAYDARMEIQEKKIMKTEKAMKDLVDYRTEIKELERLITHEQCLRDFMTTKCRNRTELNFSGRIEMLEEWKTNSEVAAETLENVFSCLLKMSGEDDLKMVVTKFIQAELKNLSLLGNENTQISLTKDLHVQMNTIKEKMEQYQVMDLQQKQDQQSNLKQMEEEYDEAIAQAIEYEVQAEEITKILNQTEKELSLAIKTDRDCAEMDNLLGSSSGNISANIKTFLELVEQKTNDLLNLHTIISSKDQDVALDKVLHGQIVGKQRQATSSCDDHEKEELLPLHKDSEPLTQDEDLVD